MSTLQAAKRVVEIHNLLVAETMCSASRAQLLEEQRKLWDEQFPGRPFEVVVKTATIH